MTSSKTITIKTEDFNKILKELRQVADSLHRLATGDKIRE